MTASEVTVEKIRQLPESLAQEVSDFVDFLLMRQDSIQQQHWKKFTETLALSETDFSDYLSNLEEYEDRLAHGEIKW
jgi:hypothetical protein